MTNLQNNRLIKGFTDIFLQNIAFVDNLLYFCPIYAKLDAYE